jgi:hypothetical protein
MPKRYIVLRGVEGTHAEGMWYELEDTPVVTPQRPPETGTVTFERTHEYETREDGIAAEVWRPIVEESGYNVYQKRSRE